MLDHSPREPQVAAERADRWCAGAVALDPARPLPQRLVYRPGARILRGGATLAGIGLALVLLLGIGALFDPEPMSGDDVAQFAMLLGLPVVAVIGFAIAAAAQPLVVVAEVDPHRVRVRERWMLSVREWSQPMSAYAGLAMHARHEEQRHRRWFATASRAGDGEIDEPVASSTRYWIELVHAADRAFALPLHHQVDGAPPLDLLERQAALLARPVLSSGGVRRATVAC